MTVEVLGKNWIRSDLSNTQTCMAFLYEIYKISQRVTLVQEHEQINTQPPPICLFSKLARGGETRQRSVGVIPVDRLVKHGEIQLLGEGCIHYTCWHSSAKRAKQH